MTNKEFYRDEIFEIACEGHRIAVVNGEPVGCDDLPSCDNCDFSHSTHRCKSDFFEWLEKEHEEPEFWSTVPVDAKILVRNYEDDEWKPRHFASFKGGDVYAWAHGCTSHTSKTPICWEYAKLAKETNRDGNVSRRSTCLYFDRWSVL